jgi:hypothetical protein
MSTQVTIYSSAGRRLTEIEADLQSVLWRLGETGSMSLTAGFETTPAILRPGNRVAVTFSSGLQDWGGVIDFPRRRHGSGLEIQAFEGDRLLSWRLTSKIATFSSSAPGAIVEALLTTANTISATGIVIGGIYESGSHTRDYHYNPLLDAIRGLREDSGHDYVVMPHLVGTTLYLELEWLERRGADRRDDVALSMGQNVGTVDMNEQGPVHNHILAVGGSTDWASVPIGEAEDPDSQDLYGVRQLAKFYFDTDDQDTLDDIAEALLDELAYPRVRATLGGVTDKAPGASSSYVVGDIVTLRAFQDMGEWSYDGPVRVISQQWNPDETCTVEVEEWRD